MEPATDEGAKITSVGTHAGDTISRATSRVVDRHSRRQVASGRGWRARLSSRAFRRSSADPTQLLSIRSAGPSYLVPARPERSTRASYLYTDRGSEPTWREIRCTGSRGSPRVTAYPARSGLARQTTERSTERRRRSGRRPRPRRRDGDQRRHRLVRRPPRGERPAASPRYRSAPTTSRPAQRTWRVDRGRIVVDIGLAHGLDTILRVAELAKRSRRPRESRSCPSPRRPSARSSTWRASKGSAQRTAVRNLAATVPGVGLGFHSE